MQKQIKSFWNWFIVNEKQLEEAFLNRKFNDEVFNNLNRKLGYVSKRIGFIIIGNKSKKLRLIITAHGYTKLFPKVKAIIKNAPRIANWKFQSLIKPKLDVEKYQEGNDLPYIFPDFELKISELYFRPLEFNTFKKNMKIVVYINNHIFHFNNEALAEAIQIIIQDLIGEVNFKKSIALVQLAQLPDNPQNLVHLYELQEYIDLLNKINRKVKIDV